MRETCAGLSSLKEVLKTWFEKLEKDELRKALLLAWNSWFGRADKVFNNKNCPAELVRNRVRAAAQTVGELQQKAACGWEKKTGSKVRWSPPPAGVLKINCDAAFLPGDTVGLGVVIRDEMGRVQLAASKRVHGRWSPQVAECNN